MNVFKIKIILMLISLIPISGKGEKGAVNECDNAPNKSNIPTAFQALSLIHI